MPVEPVTGWIHQLASFLARFRIIYSVMPWEQALRVRLGSRIKRVGPGYHWKLPFFDRVFVQNTRLHVVSGCSQTLKCATGTYAIVNCVGFAIVDLEKLYQHVQQIDNALSSWAGAALAELIGEYPERVQLEEAVAASVREKATQWGIHVEFCRLTDFTPVRAYRLLQGDRWSYSNIELSEFK